ncbi:MAG: hypothetical protein RQ982_00315 [Gammaproteobacteria bacterium]|nr:hypothetical protein [Gammaproteobacteria bacterium]
MNVFVLNTGRCGSTTFIKACRHITNYSAAHESLLTQPGPERLSYPENHIEADNRLAWFLGRLQQKYADDAFYVHLKREPARVITSFAKRIDFGILKAYEQGILMHEKHLKPAEDIARDYVETVNTNIELFLKDKTKKMDFRIETARSDFTGFWNAIEAQGDLESALKEWDINYNAS